MQTAFLCGTALTPPNDPRATIDFETRSEVDIMKQGAWVYSQHPSTEVLCLGIRLPHWPEARLWCPTIKTSWGQIDERDPEARAELLLWIAGGGLVEAHNAFFERSVWTNVCVARLGWPAVPEAQWRCSAAKACMYSLPRALGTACAALDLPVQKDGEGRKAMLKLCKPRKARKAEELEALAEWELDLGDHPQDRVWWHDDLETFETLFAYCRTDVDAEHGLSAALPDLPEHELRIWQMDQAMNLRGVQSDVAMARIALDLVDEVTRKMTRELQEITGIKDLKPSGRVRVRQWLADQGVAIDDTQGGTLDRWIAKKDFKAAKPGCHRVMVIVREANRTSTAKYKAVLLMAGTDGRIRDLMMYHGANTGRWSGKGLQPHNFPRGNVKDMEAAVAAILTGDLAFIGALYGEVIELLSGALRGVLMASEGKELMVADYAAIEARVIAWLARADQALEVFRSGKCIYMDMATSIYGYPVTDKKKQSEERQMGKQAILGLGFGMGFVTFLLTCRGYNITFTVEQARRIVKDRWTELEDYMERYFHPEKYAEPHLMRSARQAGRMRRRRIEKENLTLEGVMHELILMKFIVDAYRAKYPKIVAMWKDLEAAAIAAVQAPGRRVTSELGRVTYVVEGRFLKCILPSGRALHYCDPRVINKKLPWGDTAATLVYMSVDPLTKRWVSTDTYGGKLAENVTQAVARDLMAEAMVAADEDPLYSLLLSVHDELICEVDEGEGSVEEFERLMSRSPAWADGCPVAAEGWRGKRYRK
jgi:DNA polymerase